MSSLLNQSKPLTIKVSKDSYIENYLLLWKGYLNLTLSDINILIEFITIFNKLKSTNTNDDLCFIETFSKENRKVIADKLKISEYSFNNTFMRLKNQKGIIEKTRYGYRLNSKVFPTTSVTFIFKIEE
jgi:hypothetical protein